jgi:hypothetical protein
MNEISIVQYNSDTYVVGIHLNEKELGRLAGYATMIKEQLSSPVPGVPESELPKYAIAALLTNLREASKIG